VAYALENARYQWLDGERRMQGLADADRRRLERAVDVLVDELRRRLGSSFTLRELAELYGQGTDWATDLATRRAGTLDPVTAVDAAFARYAREASDYGGGRPPAPE
jgi:hypothetical protein